MRLLELEQGTAEWLAVRRQYRPASETPAVMGASPFQTARQLWEVRTGRREVFVSAAMREGTRREDEVRQKAAKRYAEEWAPIVAISGEYLASLDGISGCGSCVLEIKVSRKTYAAAVAGEIPRHYALQMQHQMMVTGAGRAILAAMDPDTGDVAYVELSADKDVQQAICEAWDCFWPQLDKSEFEHANSDQVKVIKEFFDLIPAEPSTVEAMFLSGDKLEELMTRIELRVRSVQIDASTDHGRKAISSLAMQVSKTKVKLDEMGKERVAALKELPKMIDAGRKFARDRFDALRDEVRKPLEDWEAEQKHKAEEAERETAARRAEEEAAEMRRQVEAAHELALYMDAEFDRKRADEAEQRANQQREHDARIAEEAAQQATKDAEARIQAEREAAARRETEARRMAEDAERRAAQAEADAKLAAERAAAAERKRQADEAAAADAERKLREADRKHRATINRAARDGLVSAGLTEDAATEAIKAIAAGKVRGVTINY